jgi:hypothetical protein
MSFQDTGVDAETSEKASQPGIQKCEEPTICPPLHFSVFSPDLYIHPFLPTPQPQAPEKVGCKSISSESKVCTRPYVP